ncbi:hypothetical protein [Yinghuangia sp. YIM S09857]|uniref:hypothetical protein n=1 Tax=Yinghuangia sp. YIM S09857 TaxID=3436929 RepID=UPI003F52CAE0
MRVPIRRIAGVVAVPLFLAVATACAGGGDGGRKAPDALDGDELRTVLLAQPELPQGWEVTGGGAAVDGDEIAEADRSACQPVMDLVSGRSADISPTGQADTGLLGPDGLGGAAHLGVNQYKEGDAAKLLDAARGALPTCAGFGVRQADGDSVAPAAATPGEAPWLGDGALFFRLTMTTDAGPLSIPYTVVRKGSALVLTSTLNDPGADTDAVPEALLRSQVDKLAKAQLAKTQAKG